MNNLSAIREQIRSAHLQDEKELIKELFTRSTISLDSRTSAKEKSLQIIKDIRSDKKPAILEVFLAEYGLSNNEGIALMCLAEALMRVPDEQTIDELIEDKIVDTSWSRHKGSSDSMLVNASTWGLMLTGKILDGSAQQGIGAQLKNMVKRLGEPVIRTAIKRAMKELGSQFVLGQTISEAVKRGKSQAKNGYTFSYDMLGEAALTRQDAKKFYDAYYESIQYLGHLADSDDVAENPGISIKLSALHPRYEVAKKQQVLTELVDNTLRLTLAAKSFNLGLNIDAEEADRLDLSLDIIEAVLRDVRLQDWNGFGVVVQAYSKRAPYVIDWLNTLAEKHQRNITVRLVKGAYWDTEIKRYQVEGLKDFPVFTHKTSTDCCYLHCAEKLLKHSPRIYPQFATHNANSIAAILTMANSKDAFEFQRLHGMGEVLHRLVKEKENVRCRIYAPVGPHKDLLAYLVRRLLENGANSSFVNQLVNPDIDARDIAEDPFATVFDNLVKTNQTVKLPKDLFGNERVNSGGWDLHDELDIAVIEKARNKFINYEWLVESITVQPLVDQEYYFATNPSNTSEEVARVVNASEADVLGAIESAANWTEDDAAGRARILKKAANLFEYHFGEFFALLTREAGKTPLDAIAELREAVDFLRFYANEGIKLENAVPCGVITCISPWNFPLAIFTGQIAAALATGNAVLAKPAEQTPATAHVAVSLLHLAGVPKAALQLLIGPGRVIGSLLTGHSKISGVCFTGSTATAKKIDLNMAGSISPHAPLIAETGGLNAMIVDSTALPEQAIRDIIASAFQSAGQRCSALRVLYLQEDIASVFLEMLQNAMDEITVGNPWQLETDVGPVIDEASLNKINQHIEKAKRDGRLVKQISVPDSGWFVAPTVIKIDSIKDLKEEIFGPVLHIATFKADSISNVLEDINSTGFGLTFGLHSRINKRVEQITSQLNVGNIYVNRNQIGAIVGSQPFGGEGLSGTGPKAGGPNYTRRFTKELVDSTNAKKGVEVPFDILQERLIALGKASEVVLQSTDLPGPTGEQNTYSILPRGTVLCLGPTPSQAIAQDSAAKQQGCSTLLVCPGISKEMGLDGFLNRQDLARLDGFDAVACWSDEEDLRAIRCALAGRDGAILPLITEQEGMRQRCIKERHVCIDTTAAGGNAELLAQYS